MEQVANPSDAVIRIQAASVRNYIYWSTLLGVFSGALRFRAGVWITLFDGIIILNLMLMLPLKNVVRIPWRILLFILYLALSGAIGIARGTDSLGLAAKELLGISASVVYFYYFFKMIGNDFERAFYTYTTIAYWFAVIALPIWAGTCIYLHQFVRLKGLTAEPTAFCFLVLSAYYWYAYQYFTFRRYGARVLVFTLTFVLAGSTNGYVAVAFGALLLLSGRGRLRHLIAIPLVLAGMIGLAYAGSADFRLRVDDMLRAAVTQTVTGSDPSTFALVSNMFVTRQVLRESPIIGNGLGSHPISHDRFLADIPGVGQYVQAGMGDLNAPEAASLALRSLSELGIVGFSAILIFVFNFHVGGAGTRGAISNAILAVFFIKLIRDGGYFGPEQFFFVFTYILNYRTYRLGTRSNVRRASLRFSWCP